ncbi:uncharacterized protein LOC141592001 isoform X1 [Silene latifolia]|uniref:uncharacterized protein LOC141592001 isoform X1 n=1 Tax=Silene latifolia TaxID=37657 RepID=UPI003D78A04A
MYYTSTRVYIYPVSNTSSSSRKSLLTVSAKFQSIAMATKTISFQTNHGGKLKTAIEALSLANSKGSGIIDIDPTNGLKISSIPDSNSGLTTFMCLKPNELENFQCSQPLMNKMVNLKFLLRMLQAIEEDGINFYQENGSSMLSFESGKFLGFFVHLILISLFRVLLTYPGIVLGVGLQENNVGFNAYSGTMSRTCEAIIPTEALNTMIPEMITNGFTQLVTVDITSAEMKFLIGKTEWEFRCNMEIGENAGLASG